MGLYEYCYSTVQTLYTTTGKYLFILNKAYSYFISFYNVSIVSSFPLNHLGTYSLFLKQGFRNKCFMTTFDKLPLHS